MIWTLIPPPPPLPEIVPFSAPKVIAPYPMSNGELTTSCAGMNSWIGWPPFAADSALYDLPRGLKPPNGTVIRLVVDTEQGGIIPPYECVVYTDLSQLSVIVKQLKPWQVVSWNLYPDPTDTHDVLLERGTEAIQVCTEHGLQFIVVTGAWNRGTLTDDEVLMGMQVCNQVAAHSACLGLFVFGLHRGDSAIPTQFKPVFQACADLYSSPGLPVFPTQPVPPKPVDNSTVVIARRR